MVWGLQLILDQFNSYLHYWALKKKVLDSHDQVVCACVAEHVCVNQSKVKKQKPSQIDAEN